MLFWHHFGQFPQSHPNMTEKTLEVTFLALDRRQDYETRQDVDLSTSSQCSVFSFQTVMTMTLSLQPKLCSCILSLCRGPWLG